MSDEPFLEHPTGEHADAVGAMEAAISRLRALPDWTRSITFCAQGQGASPDGVHFAEIRILSNVLELNAPLDVEKICSFAKVPSRAFSAAGGTRYSIAEATPNEAAKIMDALFRHQFQIRPFPEEGDDYPVGAEWANVG